METGIGMRTYITAAVTSTDGLAMVTAAILAIEPAMRPLLVGIRVDSGSCLSSVLPAEIEECSPEAASAGICEASRERKVSSEHFLSIEWNVRRNLKNPRAADPELDKRAWLPLA